MCKVFFSPFGPSQVCSGTLSGVHASPSTIQFPIYIQEEIKVVNAVQEGPILDEHERCVETPEGFSLYGFL